MKPNSVCLPSFSLSGKTLALAWSEQRRSEDEERKLRLFNGDWPNTNFEGNLYLS